MELLRSALGGHDALQFLLAKTMLQDPSFAQKQMGA